MLMSDIIANMIEEMLSESKGSLELKRNDLAAKIGCVQSQINYVITSRFTPERGYMIESRRGGGGYVRITKVAMTGDEYLMHFFHAIGASLDVRSARAFVKALTDNKIITQREAGIMLSVLGLSMDDSLRASLMKQMILSVMNS